MNVWYYIFLLLTSVLISYLSVFAPLKLGLPHAIEICYYYVTLP